MKDFFIESKLRQILLVILNIWLPAEGLARSMAALDKGWYVQVYEPNDWSKKPDRVDPSTLNDWSNLQGKSLPPIDDKNFWLKTTLPETIGDYEAMFLPMSLEDIEVYIDQEKIFRL